MVRKYRISISECIVKFLREQGVRGATAGEIRNAVWEELGDEVPVSSIYSVLYARIPGAKGDFKPYFERFSTGEQNKYRLLRSFEKDFKRRSVRRRSNRE